MMSVARHTQAYHRSLPSLSLSLSLSTRTVHVYRPIRLVLNSVTFTTVVYT